MKYTLKQQLASVNEARNFFRRLAAIERLKGVKLKANETVQAKLNDAASTLAAVNFIGSDAVLIAQELIIAVKQFLKDSEDETMHFPSYWQMKKVIERLPK